MAYRLKLKEPLVKGVRRIASEQLANASGRLQPGCDLETGVHEARKSLKRTRALLRLIRPGLGESQFRTANGRLRDIAGALSAARDRDVVRALLTDLMQGKPSEIKAARSLLTQLDAAPAVGREPDQVARDVAEAAREIDAQRRVLAEIDLHPANFQTIVAGLTKSHRSGCKALARAIDNPEEEEALHDLRKAAQAYWRQMILIQQCWPEACLARARAAKVVADLLGKDHDIALLDTVLAGPEGQALSHTDRNVLLRVCKVRHAELRGMALPKSQLLFAEQSQRLGERVHELWEASRRAARTRSPTEGADAVTVGARKTS